MRVALMNGRRRPALKRRIEITVEEQRVVLVSNRKVLVAAWCGSCGLRSTFISPAEAARLAGMSAREIYRRIEADDLHSLDTEDGDLLVCRNSL